MYYRLGSRAAEWQCLMENVDDSWISSIKPVRIPPSLYGNHLPYMVKAPALFGNRLPYGNTFPIW